MSGVRRLKGSTIELLADNDLVGPTPQQKIPAYYPQVGLGMQPTRIKLQVAAAQNVGPGASANINWTSATVTSLFTPANKPAGMIAPFTSLDVTSVPFTIKLNGTQYLKGSFVMNALVSIPTNPPTFATTAPYVDFYLNWNDNNGALNTETFHTHKVISEYANFGKLESIVIPFMIAFDPSRTTLAMTVTVTNNCTGAGDILHINFDQSYVIIE